MRRLLYVFLLGVLACARAQEFSSGSTRVHLLELFTSEGCSSCPPAEAWLSQQREASALWHDVVPIAWHVDYWDNLGWKDVFASKAATSREYALANRWHSESVYTPCFAVDGAEWTRRLLPAAASDVVGSLRVVRKDPGLEIAFEPTQPGDYEAHAELLTMNARVNVRAGENAGRSLRHDFVATGPEKHARLVNGHAQLLFPVVRPLNSERHALAVWITATGEIEPVQATGGWLEK